MDDSYRVLHLSEDAGRFLQPSAGPLTTDITDLVRQELRFEVRAALGRALELGETTLTGAIFVRFNGHAQRVYLQVRPVQPQGEDTARQALVLFITGGASDPLSDSAPDAEESSSPTVERLKRELELTQARLRTTREESEAANEELRAANEELQSINEEYRSTGEELETSKEELQSINEELQTVNSELKIKLDTVSRANSDLQNLMGAMDFGLLFLDPTLRIKRFTPRLADLFSITPSDIGRPITDFAHQLNYDDLARDVGRVLEDLSPIEREIRSREGAWYVVRFRPYRTVDDKIDGVVATFLDVTERRRMEDALREGEERLRQGMARQQLLLNELTHRVKNTLTVIQSMVRQTWRHSQGGEDFVHRLEGRILAMAEAHKLLIQSDWRGADLRQLVEGQLAVYIAEGQERIRIEGEAVTLPADLATPLGLVLHELATNGAKYGSLSVEGGQVELTWNKERAESRDGNTRLRVVWAEKGGPPVEKPSFQGFGSRLIAQAVPGVRARQDFRQEGLVCTLQIPLPEPVHDGDDGY